jgi:hypothetical protein
MGSCRRRAASDEAIRKEQPMIRGTLGLALAGLLMSSVTAQAIVVAPSLSGKHSLIEKADVEYCYWKLKKNGKWKLKCDD